MSHSDDRRDTDHHGHDVISPLHVGAVTVSTSRANEPSPDDESGDEIQRLFEEDGHAVVSRTIVPDDRSAIRREVRTLCRDQDVDVVVTTGGTGVTPDDVTPEAVEDLFDREIPGFGERFRALSWDEIGTRAMASRATAGIVGGTPVFAVPGSSNAVRTACSKLIVPESPHLAGMATRRSTTEEGQ